MTSFDYKLPVFFQLFVEICFVIVAVIMALRLVRAEKSTNIKIRHINHQRTGVY